MSTKLFHRDLGIPDGLDLWTFKVWKLDYSKHALQAALTDRYGLPKRLPKSIQFTEAHIFEVEVFPTRFTALGIGTKFQTVKVCIRVPACEGGFEGPRPGMDLCLALVRGDEDDVLKVTTLWFNERADTHATLDRSKYSTP